MELVCAGCAERSISLPVRKNFPLMPKPTEAAWRKAVAATKRTHDTLVRTVAALPDARLRDRVPGKRYDFYHLLHGIAQHELYHAGQIAILKKAQEGVARAQEKVLGVRSWVSGSRPKTVSPYHCLKITATAATISANPAR